MDYTFWDLFVHQDTPLPDSSLPFLLFTFYSVVRFGANLYTYPFFFLVYRSTVYMSSFRDCK